MREIMTFREVMARYFGCCSHLYDLNGKITVIEQMSDEREREQHA